MRLAVKLLLAATAIPTAFSDAQDAVETASRPVAEVYQDNLNLEYYVGSNARWLVDRRLGVISALSLDNASPLWSKDGVVFRAAHTAILSLKEVTPSQNATSRPAIEAFGRVYFFLDAPSLFQDVAPRFQNNALLVALDSKAQGRLAWKLNVQEFAPFFSPEDRRDLRFLNKIQSTANDELLVSIQSERELKRFALDAATGRPRFLESPTISK